MKTIPYSKETKTVIEIFEQLSGTGRKLLLEKIQDILMEYESEKKWEQLLESSPGPMLQMAQNALKEHKQGRSKLLKL